MALTISGTLSFLGKLTAIIAAEILDYGLLTEGLTEGTENYNLITQSVNAADDFGSII